MHLAIVDLPLPDSPTSPSISPGRSSNETPLTACTSGPPSASPPADSEVLDEVDDLERGRAVLHQWTVFGSSTSRSASPRRLKASAASTIASPGEDREPRRLGRNDCAL